MFQTIANIELFALTKVARFLKSDRVEYLLPSPNALLAQSPPVVLGSCIVINWCAPSSNPAQAQQKLVRY